MSDHPEAFRPNPGDFTSMTWTGPPITTERRLFTALAMMAVTLADTLPGKRGPVHSAKERAAFAIADRDALLAALNAEEA